jgi:hypothetical protein
MVVTHEAVGGEDVKDVWSKSFVLVLPNTEVSDRLLSNSSG